MDDNREQESVLVADDEPDFLEGFTNLLEGNNISVLTAASGEEALKILEKESDEIPVVISDQRMPKLKIILILLVSQQTYFM